VSWRSQPLSPPLARLDKRGRHCQAERFPTRSPLGDSATARLGAGAGLSLCAGVGRQSAGGLCYLASSSPARVPGRLTGSPARNGCVRALRLSSHPAEGIHLRGKMTARVGGIGTPPRTGHQSRLHHLETLEEASDLLGATQDGGRAIAPL
jgi:hypothetical protein